MKPDFAEFEKLILGILHSNLFWFFISHSSANLGGAVRLMPSYLDDFSFPKVDSSNKKLVDKIIALVDKILAIKKLCHTERSEVSQPKIQNRDISVSAKPQYDKTLSGDISAFSKSQYDKVASGDISALPQILHQYDKVFLDSLPPVEVENAKISDNNRNILLFLQKIRDDKIAYQNRT